VITFFHYLINVKKQSEEIKLTFPVRGNSYMECNKDFGAVIQANTEDVCGMKCIICSYTVVKMEQTMFLMSKYLANLYVKHCPFPT